MAEAWRLVREKYAATAFSGEGAARAGGRWNSRGTRMVYASSTRALAALETLVHLNPPVFFRYVFFPLRFEDALVERLPASRLPAGWRESPPSPAVQAVGDRWVAEGRSAVLEVPCVLVPGESNFLLNPAHPDFAKIVIGGREEFSFDRRLLREKA